MSRDIVMVVQGPFQHAFGLLEKYIEVCPDTVWNEVNGGWPVWQQIYHAVNALDFFVGEADCPPVKALFPPEVGKLACISTYTMARSVAKELAQATKSRVEVYIGKLSDDDLTSKNEGLSQRMGVDMAHGSTLALLAAHTLYHVGSCDAALRDHGIKGVF